MRTIPQCYYHPELLNVIKLYICEGYKSYDALSESDQEVLVAKCIKILGTDAYSCIIEPDDFNITLHHLMQFLKTGQREYAFDLAETMAKNAHTHFSDVLYDLYAEKYEEWETEVKCDAGLRPIKDQINGETRWV